MIEGDNLRVLRRNLGYTQRCFALMAGVSSRMYQKYESGQNEFPEDRARLLEFELIKLGCKVE